MMISPIRILGVGRFIEVKGFRYLVEAMAVLKDGNIPAALTLAGDGPMRKPLERLARERGLSETIYFKGSLSQQAVWEQYARHDILVVPSVPAAQGVREGIPVVIMEAMLAGLAVIATRESGIPEVVHHERTGLLVPPRDPAAIAQAVRRFSQEVTLRESCRTQARRNVEEDFNITKIAARKAALLSRSENQEERLAYV